MHNRLRELRENRGLQRYDIAAALRVDQSTVSRWEAGGTIPDRQKLRLAELLEVSISELMGWDTEPSEAAA
jgi:transcriptional regulator with XRE-family HTH domain